MVMLRCTEQRRSGRYDVSIDNQLIRQMNFQRILTVEIKMRHPLSAVGRCVDLEGSLFDYGRIRTAQRPFYGSNNRLTRLIRNVKVCTDIDWMRQGVDKRFLIDLSMLLTGKQNRCEHLLLCVLQGFPVSVVIDACPGCYRPDIVQLPYNSTHAGTTEAAEMLYAVTDGICLKKL